ncbi:MAG: H-NS histone family protein [Gammaproteobacteria bacterium]|nr:H-NS histone family protein [Gammaproteobacteria bacterium]
MAVGAQKEVDRREHESKLETIRQMKDMARRAGISPDEFATLFSTEKPKAAVKYRNPENESETWSGRGKRPRWLQEKLESGRTLDEFRV